MKKFKISILTALVSIFLCGTISCSDSEPVDSPKEETEKPGDQENQENPEKPDESQGTEDDPSLKKEALIGGWTFPLNISIYFGHTSYSEIVRMSIIFAEDSSVKITYNSGYGGYRSGDYGLIEESDSYVYELDEDNIHIYKDEDLMSSLKYSITGDKLTLTLAEGEPFPSFVAFGEEYVALPTLVYTKEEPLDISLTMSGVTVADGKFYTAAFQKAKIENVDIKYINGEVPEYYPNFLLDLHNKIDTSKYLATGTLPIEEHTISVGGKLIYVDSYSLALRVDFPFVIVESIEDLPEDAPELGTYSLSVVINDYNINN